MILQKLRHIDLLKKGVVCILCAYVTFLASESISQETDATVPLEVKEAQVARESAEKKALELELELRKMRGEYDALRSRYAALYVESREKLRKLEEMEIEAQRLIQGKQNGDAEKADVLEVLDLMVKRQIVVQQTLLDFEKSLSSLMEVLQASDAVKVELKQRLTLLEKAVDDSLKPIPMLTNLENGRENSANAQVVSLNAKEESAILDKGSLNGVRPGKVWCLLDKEGVVLAKLQTVACRPDFCIAVMLQGKMTLLNQGSILHPDR